MFNTNLNNFDIFSVTLAITKQFLHHVSFGEQKEAEKMLKINKKLATAYGDLTDCADRNFKKITGFQYAVLALDYHMWSMIKKYLTKEDIRIQLQEIISVAKLNEQQGWIIMPEVNTYWPPITWVPLINALETYLKNYDAWDYEKCSSHWCQQVGGAQLILPAHVINEYSHPSRPFYPCPKWDNEEPELPRTGVASWRIEYDYKLGTSFAWLRADMGLVPASLCLYYARYDLAAVSELLKSRTEKVQKLLESELIFSVNSSSRPKFL